MKHQYDQSDSLSHMNSKTPVRRGSLRYAQIGVSCEREDQDLLNQMILSFDKCICISYISYLIVRNVFLFLHIPKIFKIV
jgi:hypothetical protein